MPVRLVVVTDGGSKVSGWLPGQDPVQVAPPRIEIRDTVGAGDAFQTAHLARLTDHAKPTDVLSTLGTGRLTELLTFAATAASIICSSGGADPPSRNDIINKQGYETRSFPDE